MKLHFDSDQAFQKDAVSAVVDLFEGLPLGEPMFSVIKIRDGEESLFSGQEQGELGLGNRSLLDTEKLRENARKVQERNGIEIPNANASLESWVIHDPTVEKTRECPHFSIEMETGTGKTYVYLRTIFELSHRYGFKKFVIVVPSVAVREGVLKNIEITAEHFRLLYNNRPESFVYDAKQSHRLRQFATANMLQVLIINIDAFNKSLNVIHKESDKLSGRQPIEFVQTARPIVIIDEPQSVDNTETARKAIQTLNPLCTLRYSATHKNPYNLMYRLDPVQAFELGLVKQIVVASAEAESSGNDAFIRVDAIDYKTAAGKPKIHAKLRIHAQTKNGPREKKITIKKGDDLYSLSDDRLNYAQGFSVAEINAEPGSEFIRFTNGLRLGIGQEHGGVRSDIQRVQIRHTIRRHLEKELQVRSLGIKVLSLFFLDRVANYRAYDADGKSIPGKLAVIFREELNALAKEERYRCLDWLCLPTDDLHAGYFAQDKKGTFKDTRGDTQADDDAYNLIMKEKERLLSLEEPLRFIFSHSALREGWDNPNVFQICALRDMSTERERRQTIGRGLRLPVDQSGQRVFDQSVNKLYVMANESYEEFARGLQAEYEEAGILFGRVPFQAFSALTRMVDGEEIPLEKSEITALRVALMEQGMLDAEGRIGKAFTPSNADFILKLPDSLADLRNQVIDLLSSHRIERHVKREKDEGHNRLRKEIRCNPYFQTLWERIKAKTTYRVEFDTDTFVQRAVEAIRLMPSIEAPKITVTAGLLDIRSAGISALMASGSEEESRRQHYPMPDILAYLQDETELTRSTLVRILFDSGRLSELFLNPQRFMDEIVRCIKGVLHAILLDGIKYERIAGEGEEAAWEMLKLDLEASREIINYLTAQRLEKSLYEYVPYDSEVEREFALGLETREDVELFLKLPKWFTVETPVGKYNPDWAIVKKDSETLYLIRETKGSMEREQLRIQEDAKIRCGKRHFEALGVDFKVVTHVRDL